MIGGVAGGGKPLAAQGADVVLLGHAGGGHHSQPRWGVEDVVQGAFELGCEVGEVGLAADDSVHHGCQVHIVHDTAQVRGKDAHVIAIVGVSASVIVGISAVIGSVVVVVGVVVEVVQLRIVVAFDAPGDEILVDSRVRLAVEVAAKNQGSIS